MEELLRSPDATNRGSGGAAPASGLSAIRAEIDRLYSAASQIVRSTLSSDSEAYNRASRQGGGQ